MKFLSKSVPVQFVYCLMNSDRVLAHSRSYRIQTDTDLHNINLHIPMYSLDKYTYFRTYTYLCMRVFVACSTHKKNNTFLFMVLTKIIVLSNSDLPSGFETGKKYQSSFSINSTSVCISGVVIILKSCCILN